MCKECEKGAGAPAGENEEVAPQNLFTTGEDFKILGQLPQILPDCLCLQIEAADGSPFTLLNVRRIGGSCVFMGFFLTEEATETEEAKGFQFAFEDTAPAGTEYPYWATAWYTVEAAEADDDDAEEDGDAATDADTNDSAAS